MSQRILIASKTPLRPPGGLAQYASWLSAQLQERGLEVEFAFWYDDNEVVHSSADIRQEPKRFGRNWAQSSHRRVLPRLFSRTAFHALAMRACHRAVLLKELEELVKTVDAVHFVGTGWDGFGFPLASAAKKCGLPFTVWPAVHPMQWGDDAIDIRFYQMASAVFTQTGVEKAHLERLGVPEERMIQCGLAPMCLPSGDPRRFRKRYALGDRPTVLFLGRRDDGKGYPALLKAWPLVLQEVPDACLLLAGPGVISQELLNSLPAESYLNLGVVNEEGKADALSACDVFCLPSTHESFGIVYVEAWSYSKPVVCGTAPACRELIHHRNDGIWSSQVTEELAADLIQLLRDPAGAATMGARGRQRQLASFSWSQVVEKHLRAWGVEVADSAEAASH